MRYIHTILLISLVVSGSVAAQREMPAVSSFEEFRQSGEIRRWTFARGDSAVGYYRSQVLGTEQVNDQTAWVIEHRMVLETGKPDDTRTMEMQGRHFVAPDGSYLGDERQMNLGDMPEEMQLLRNGDSLLGYITRDDIRQDVAYYVDLEPPAMAWDHYFLDLYEFALAFTDLRVGDTLSSRAFAPQVGMLVEIQGTVDEFRGLRGRSGTTDSVFVVRLKRPQPQTLYFSTERRLVAAVLPVLGLQARLDAVQNPRAETPTGPRLSATRFLRMIPVWLIYACAALISLALYSWRHYRSPKVWLAMLAGALSFIVIPWTQSPLQMVLFEDLLLPRVSAGGSPWLWSLLPAFAGGLIQEVLRAIVVLLLFNQLNPARGSRIPMAAFAGAGFGLIEAIWMTIAAPDVSLYSFQMLERGFMILYHTTAGAALGWALRRGVQNERCIIAALGLVFFNGLLRYLPVFVQQKAISLEVMYFVMPLIILGLTIITLVLLKRPEASERV